MYEKERRLYCPATLELKSLQNLFSSIGDTAAHTVVHGHVRRSDTIRDSF